MSEAEQKTIQELYLSVGVALGAWSLVEKALADIFADLVLFDVLDPVRVGVNRHIPRTAFWQARAFATRLGMVDALMKLDVIPVKGLRAEWGKLNQKLRRKNSLRNKIAHGIVRTLWVKLEGGERRATAFHPFADEAKDREFSAEYTRAIEAGGLPYSTAKMTVTDLDLQIRDFNCLADDVEHFRRKIVEAFHEYGCRVNTPSADRQP